MAKAFDPKIVEAEENLLIDFHFLIQQLMSEKGITRSQLAEKAGLSKARLSQLLNVEANPTVKSMARLFHALGEEVRISTKKSTADRTSSRNAWLSEAGQQETVEWRWERRVDSGARIDDRLVELLKREDRASNDNYSKVLFMESELSLAPDAEAA